MVGRTLFWRHWVLKDIRASGRKEDWNCRASRFYLCYSSLYRLIKLLLLFWRWMVLSLLLWLVDAFIFMTLQKCLVIKPFCLLLVQPAVWVPRCAFCSSLSFVSCKMRTPISREWMELCGGAAVTEEEGCLFLFSPITISAGFLFLFLPCYLSPNHTPSLPLCLFPFNSTTYLSTYSIGSTLVLSFLLLHSAALMCILLLLLWKWAQLWAC